jgi:lysyl-tRNA synthetase class 2
LYLRIAPELYLKRLVWAVWSALRNQPQLSATRALIHVTTPIHHDGVVSAYADYGDMMRLTEEMLAHIAERVNGTTECQFGEHSFNMQPPFRRATMRELVRDKIGLDISGGQDLVDAFETMSKARSSNRRSCSTFLSRFRRCQAQKTMNRA